MTAIQPFAPGPGCRSAGLDNAKQITSLFVVEDERPVGFLHIHDCLRAGVG